MYAFLFLTGTHVLAQASNVVRVREGVGGIGFFIPSLSTVMTFAIRTFFVIAGLVALFYLLLGAFGWITSGGEKDGVDHARNKIQAAVIGVILIAVVLAIIATLEQVVFQRKICFGITCDLTIPTLLPSSSEFPNQ